MQDAKEAQRKDMKARGRRLGSILEMILFELNLEDAGKQTEKLLSLSRKSMTNIFIKGS